VVDGGQGFPIHASVGPACYLPASPLLVLRPMENPAACWVHLGSWTGCSIHQTSAIIRPNVLAMSAL